MKKIIVSILTFTLFFTLTISGTAETKEFEKFQLIPTDDSTADKEFSTYITKFKKAVKDKNVKSLKELIAEDVAFTFESSDGIKGLLKLWKLDKKSKNSDFWYEMDKILSMGSAFYNEDKTSYAYPYLFVTFPSDYDSYEYSAVTGKIVNVRKSPSSKSPVVETLDYEIVKTTGYEENPEKEKIKGINGTWIKVITASGNEGYIFSHYVHSPIGLRAIFQKRNGKWALTALVSGD